VLADQGATALTVIVAGSIVVPLTALAVLIWWFFRAARRFDAEQRATGAPDGSFDDVPRVR
jgi:hypothetical protein